MDSPEHTRVPLYPHKREEGRMSYSNPTVVFQSETYNPETLAEFPIDRVLTSLPVDLSLDENESLDRDIEENQPSTFPPVGSSEGPTNIQEYGIKGLEQEGRPMNEGFPILNYRSDSKTAKWIMHHDKYPNWPVTDKSGVLHYIWTGNLPQGINREHLHRDVSTHDYPRLPISFNEEY